MAASGSKLAPFMATVMAVGGLGIGLDALTKSTSDARISLTSSSTKVKVLSDTSNPVCLVAGDRPCVCTFAMFLAADEPVTAVNATLILRDGKFEPTVHNANPSEPVTPIMTAGKHAVRLELTAQKPWRDLLPASGILTATTASGGAEYLRPIKIAMGDRSYWEPIAIGATAALTFLGTLVTGIVLRAKKIAPSHRMGSPSWRAGDSWASNVTVGAGLISSLMTLVISDQTVYMSPTTYRVVTALLSAILALSPVVYSLFRMRTDVSMQDVGVADRISLLQTDTNQFEGFVFFFLAAGWLTLWATTGQLVVLNLLIYELAHLRIITDFTQGLVVGASSLIGFGLLAYGFASLYRTAKTASIAAAPPKPAGLAAAPAPVGPTAPLALPLAKAAAVPAPNPQHASRRRGGDWSML
jgi:hypothetical protein